MKNIEKIIKDLQKDKFFFEGQFKLSHSLKYFFAKSPDEEGEWNLHQFRPIFLLKPYDKSDMTLVLIPYYPMRADLENKIDSPYLSPDFSSIFLEPSSALLLCAIEDIERETMAFLIKRDSGAERLDVYRKPDGGTFYKDLENIGIQSVEFSAQVKDPRATRNYVKNNKKIPDGDFFISTIP